MSRNKYPEVTRERILAVAQKLFLEQGYENTTIPDIVSALGDLTKGAVYHHFKSKEDIMDAIIERQSERMLSQARRIAEDKGIPVEERMLRVVMALRLEETEGAGGKGMIEHLHRPQNALMHQKSKKVIMGQVPPILAIVLTDGIEQGLFDTPYPLECMEMVVAYLNTMLDDGVVELTEEQRMDRITAFVFHLERLLGTEKGRLAYIMKMFADGE